MPLYELSTSTDEKEASSPPSFGQLHVGLELRSVFINGKQAVFFDSESQGILQIINSNSNDSLLHLYRCTYIQYIYKFLCLFGRGVI